MGCGVTIKNLKHVNNNMNKIFSLFLLIASFYSISPVYADTSIYSSFLYPSFAVNNEILYFDQYAGAIVKQNVITGEKSEIFDLIPSATNLVSISPEQSKILLYPPNISFPKYQAPFFDSSRKSPDNQWWVYDFNTTNKILLDDKINLVGWYSDNEIIYVFNNKDITVAPTNDLSKFNILYSNIPSNVDINKQIIANDNHQIIPLVDGYLVGNKKNFVYQKSTNYQISANPKLNYFLEYNNSQIKVFDWDSKQVGSIINISNRKALLLNNDTIAILATNGNLIQYNLQGQEQSNVSLNPIVTDIYSVDQSGNELLINQNNQIRTYNLLKKEQGTILLSTNTPTPNTDTNSETEQSNTLGNIAILIGGIVFLAGGLGLFIWKLRKR
jgi:hypothetical protein